MYTLIETKQKKESFIKRITEGESLRTICKDENEIDDNTLYTWLHKDKHFKEQYVHARKEQGLFYKEKIENVIAELKENDIQSRELTDIARLEIDALKWIASKLLPKVYGSATQQQLVQVNIQPITGMQIVDISTEEESAA